jgi:hypothetical protein
MIRKFYDILLTENGGWIETCNPDYDPNYKTTWEKIKSLFGSKTIKPSKPLQEEKPPVKTFIKKKATWVK